MIDIVDFDGEMFDLGFSKIHHAREFNIKSGSQDNRKNVEDKKTDILLNPETGRNKAGLVVRDSGLNDAICKIARKHDVAIGFSFSNILNSKDKLNLIANISQNIKLCRKYRLRMVMASFAKNKFEMRHAKDMHNLCLVLGMDEKEAMEALNFKKKEITPRIL